MTQVSTPSLPNPLISYIAFLLCSSSTTIEQLNISGGGGESHSHIVGAHFKLMTTDLRRTHKMAGSFNAIPLVYSLSYSPISHLFLSWLKLLFPASPPPPPHSESKRSQVSAISFSWQESSSLPTSVHWHSTFITIMVEKVGLPLSSHSPCLVAWILFLLREVTSTGMPFLSYITMSSCYGVLPIISTLIIT